MLGGPPEPALAPQFRTDHSEDLMYQAPSIVCPNIWFYPAKGSATEMLKYLRRSRTTNLRKQIPRPKAESAGGTLWEYSW
jgi:hypothetical protein